MIKFGDKVMVTKAGFFNGIKGIVVNYSDADYHYTVQLKGNIFKQFTASSLKPLNSRRGKLNEK
jgi:hypothetical protein